MSANNTTYVTMIGPEKMGKGSILAAMAGRLEAMSQAAGARFVADSETAALMNARRAALSGVFDDHLASEEFPLQGSAEDKTEPLRTYRFTFRSGVLDTPRYTLEVADIPTRRMAENSPEIIRQVQKSAVILIAVDAIALMERNEQGLSWHETVNMPNAVHTLLMDADLTQEAPHPQLVLFVPIRCEKYYHQPGGMEALQQAVRKAYALILAFLEKPRYTVGITPILTMGDVLFSRYDPAWDGCKPLFVFRRKDAAGQEHLPRYSPCFGEQPLCWMAAFLMQLEQFQQEKKRQDQSTWGKVVKEALWLYAFGLMGLAARRLTAALKDHRVRRMMEALRASMKLEGDGYALVQDHLCLGGSDMDMKQIAAQVS